MSNIHNTEILIKKLEDAVDIFDAKYPDCTAVFVFDCSSNHEGFSKDALNVKNMNVNPGGVQSKL
jgi:hypothetical protein